MFRSLYVFSVHVSITRGSLTQERTPATNLQVINGAVPDLHVPWHVLLFKQILSEQDQHETSPCSDGVTCAANRVQTK